MIGTLYVDKSARNMDPFLQDPAVIGEGLTLWSELI